MDSWVAGCSLTLLPNETVSFQGQGASLEKPVPEMTDLVSRTEVNMQL